ncbi:MAG: phage tail tape measure protein [Bifidobacterium tibiigranuli]|jgi:SLT domain-containing protein|nr:phage tail tape measure protein [Bifidobacterium tibiigranuli]
MAGRAAWVDVMPNMSLFAKTLMAGTNQAATQAGQTAGKSFAASMNSASKSDLLKTQVDAMTAAVSKAERATLDATRNIVQARDRQKAADQQVAAAEARLAEQTQKHGTASSQALKAQSQLTQAQSKATTAANQVADAEKQVSAAHKATTQATQALAGKQAELNAEEAKTPGILDRFGGSSEKAGRSAGIFGKAVSGARSMVGALGVTMGAVSLVSWVSSGVKSAEDFQKQMNLLVTAGGEEESALGGVANGIKGIAVQTGISTSQLAEGMYTMEKAQFRGADGLKVLKAAAQGATDEQVDLGVMTNALTSIMRSYNIPASQASSVTNQLVAASGEAKTTMQLFAGSLSTVLPVASAAGLSFAQVAGAIATLTSHGTSADEATQELSNTIRALQAPNNVAIREMQQFGINSLDVAKNLGKNGLTGTIGYLTQTILKNMGPSGVIMLNTFNQSKNAANDAATMFSKLTGSARDLAKGVMDGSVSSKSYRKDLQSLTPTQATLVGQWNTMYQKSKGFNDQLKSGSPTAQTYTDALKKIMGGATGMNTALMLSGGSTKTFANNVAGISESAKQNGTDISTWAETQKTAQVQTARFNQELNVSRITMASKFLPAITGIMRVTTNAATGIGDFASKHTTLIKALAITAAAVGGMIIGYKALRGAILLGQFAQIIFATATGGAALAQDSAAISAGAYATAQGIGAAASTLAAGAATAFGAALDFATGPIGLVIGAIALLAGGFILAYKHSTAFRNIVNGALDGVKNAAIGVGHFFAGPFTDFFKQSWGKVTGFFSGAFNWVKSNFKLILETIGGLLIGGPIGAAFVVLWNKNKQFRDTMANLWNGFVNVVKTIGNGIVTTFKFIITMIATVLITPWVLAWHQMEQPVTWLWHNVIEPAFNGIKNTMSAAWSIVKTTVIDAWNNELRIWGAVFTWLNASIVQPVWNAIRTAFSTSWNWIRDNVITPWDNAVSVMGNALRWLWNGIVVPAWNGMTGAFGAGWNWIRTNVVNAWNNAMTGMGNMFNWLNSNVIQPVWGSISGAFSNGWNWISQHVVTPMEGGIHAIGQTFSDTASWIGTSWDKVKDAAASPVRWVVNTVYTNGIEQVWNSVAKAVGLDLKLPDAPKFAEGGINPGYAPGHDTILAMTSPGEAWMVPEWTRAVGAGNIQRWNRLARHSGPDAVRRDMLGYAGGGVVPRFGIGGVASKAIDWTKDKAGWVKDKAVGAASAVSNAISGVAGTVTDFIADPSGSIRKWIVDPVKSMLGNVGGGDWGHMLGQFPLKIANGLVDKAKSLMSNVGGGPSGTSVNFQPGAGVAQWSSQVLQALSMLGQPASWLNTVMRRMNQESGGNPDAINNWDSNAAAGMPSQGLMQTIPGTFHAYAGPFAGRPITDPLANIYAGLNYAIHRYGSLSALDQPGGYAEGGIVPRRLYDTGGVLGQGMTLVENRSGSPELVLNQRQQDLLFSKRDQNHEPTASSTPTVNQKFEINVHAANPHSDGTIFGRSAARHALASLQGRG